MTLRRPHPSMLANAPTLLAVLSTALLAIALSAISARAQEDFDVPAHKRTRLGLYFDAVLAHAAVSENKARTLFIDVRTPEELELVGVPVLIDANVPLMSYVRPLSWRVGASSFRREVNPDFVAAVDHRLALKRLTRSDIVILICRSGDRSARAADILAGAGYKRVFTVVDGFEGDTAPSGPLAGQRAINGWKVARLPWRNLLDPGILTLGRDAD